MERIRIVTSIALLMGVLLFADLGQAKPSATNAASPFGVGVACAQLDACLVQMSWHCYHSGHGHYDYCPDGFCNPAP